MVDGLDDLAEGDLALADAASAMSDSKYISGVTLGNQPPHTMGRSGKRSRTIFATT